MNIIFKDIEKLEELQKADLKIVQTLKTLGGLPGEIEVLEKDFEDKKGALKEASAKKTKVLVMKKELENSALEKEEAVKKAQRELNAVKSNEAFKALLQQIENFKKEKDKAETGIIEAMEKADEALAVEKKAAEELSGFEKIKNGKISEIRAKIAVLEKDLEGFKAERTGKAAGIDSEMLRKYESLVKSKGGLAFAPVKKEGERFFCSGCNMSLTPDKESLVRKPDTVILCENCGRMIYLKP